MSSTQSFAARVFTLPLLISAIGSTEEYSAKPALFKRSVGEASAKFAKELTQLD
jgi:hypothetical protein